MLEDTDLRKLLNGYRENHIFAEWPNDLPSRRHCILRRAMIDHLLASKPRTVREWQLGLPPSLYRNTEPEHWRRYAPQIIALLCRADSVASQRAN